MTARTGVRRHYNCVATRLEECHDCGEIKLCNVYQADSRESGTGYLDEYAICFACETEKDRGPLNVEI